MSDLLSKACIEGDIKLLDSLIKEGADLIEMTEDYDLTPIYIACFHGQEKVLKTLIAKGVDINYLDEDGEAAIHRFSKEGNIEAIKLLIRNGADINIENIVGATPLYIACQKKE